MQIEIRKEETFHLRRSTHLVSLGHATRVGERSRRLVCRGWRRCREFLPPSLSSPRNRSSAFSDGVFACTVIPSADSLLLDLHSICSIGESRSGSRSSLSTSCKALSLCHASRIHSNLIALSFSSSTAISASTSYKLWTDHSSSMSYLRRIKRVRTPGRRGCLGLGQYLGMG